MSRVEGGGGGGGGGDGISRAEGGLGIAGDGAFIKDRGIDEVKDVKILCMEEGVDYPRDESGNITAMIHPNFQVKSTVGQC